MLPVQQIESDLVAAAGRTRRIVLRAPTGSGKSTRLPQMILDRGLVAAGEQVVVLQPRRLAARLLAKRVAAERGVTLGEEVGFHIRFDRMFNADTRIKFVTEGILMRQLLSDPTLKGVGAVVFDEFHERHLYSDLGLALVRRLQATTRPDLLMVVMSATLDTQYLVDWLPDCELLEVTGRLFPITVDYAAGGNKETDAPPWEQIAAHFKRLVTLHTEGDFLIFLPGAFEIQRTIEALRAERVARDFVILPLYGELPPAEQDAAVATYSQRKVVVATNVAETSLTIEGVRVVIDSGLARVARFDPHRGINTLLIEKISQSAAEQRAGRAGRTAPGYCLRLWGKAEHGYRTVVETPEIKRVDLAETLLALKFAGIDDFDTFEWFEAPDAPALQRAERLLAYLGALDTKTGAITELGRRMAQFPLHPRYARMLIAADQQQCVYPIALIAAFTQGRDILLPLRDKHRRTERDELLGDEASDFFHWLRAWGMARKKKYDPHFCRQWGIHGQAARQAEKTAEQFLKIAEQQGLAVAKKPYDELAVRQCLLTGFSDQLALRDGSGTLLCTLVNGRRGELRRHSAVRDARLIVAAAVDEIETRGEVTVFLSLATAIEEEWLEMFYPDDFYEAIEIVYDPKQRRVVRLYERRFRDLVFEQRDKGEPPPEAAAKLLAREIVAGNLELKSWNASVKRWIERVNFAAKCCPELNIHYLDTEGFCGLLEEFCLGATAYKDLKHKDVWPTLQAWLSREQQLGLDVLVPDEFVLPTRKRPVKIRYESDSGRAIIASKLQDFYDVDPGILKICNGQVPLVVELLAPNGRPAQITDDLIAFWQTSYAGVKKELKGRYPKHEWR